MVTLRQIKFSVIAPILYKMELRYRAELPKEIAVLGSTAAVILMSLYYTPEINTIVW